MPMADYHLAKLSADQPCLWLALVLPAFQLAVGKPLAPQISFEILRYEGESNDVAVDVLTLVCPDEPIADIENLRAAPRDEWVQLAAAVVITALLRTTTGQRIRRISRCEGGLYFFLGEPSDDEETLLFVHAAEDDDVHAALSVATNEAQFAPCANRIAAAVAFNSGKAALRVLS